MNTKPAIYLTDPAEMLKARLSQPRVSSEQFHAQLARVRQAVEQQSAPASDVTSSPGREAKHS